MPLIARKLDEALMG